jgi:hypothetical protein
MLHLSLKKSVGSIVIETQQKKKSGWYAMAILVSRHSYTIMLFCTLTHLTTSFDPFYEKKLASLVAALSCSPN